MADILKFFKKEKAKKEKGFSFSSLRVIKGKNFDWIDIRNPEKSQLEFLKKKYQIHPLALSELLPPSYRCRVDRYGDQLYLVLYYPIFTKDKKTTQLEELDIIVGKKFLVTSHYVPIAPVQRIFTRCNLYKEEKERIMKKKVDFLLYLIIENLIKECLPKLDYIAEKIEKIEKEVFAGKEKEMVSEISLVKREILDIFRAINPQEGILNSLLKIGADFFGKNSVLYFQDLLGSYGYIRSILENHSQVIETLHQTNQSLLSNKISEIMQILTAISFITFPLGVIAGIFGMNVFENIEFIKKPYTFWIILLLMAILTFSLYLIFKKRKWL